MRTFYIYNNKLFKMSKEKRIVFRIDEDVFEKFKIICEKENKSVSKILRNQIDKIVNRYESDKIIK